MTGALSWQAGPSPFCACCCEYVVRSPADYFCPLCDPKPLPAVPPPRMALDARPTPVSTTAGELL